MKISIPRTVKRTMGFTCVLALALAMAALLCACGSSGSKSSSATSASASSSAQTTSGKAASSDCITSATGEFASGTHTAVVTVAGYSPFTITLDADTAPVSVWQFCTLAKSGFYDGGTFHRIVQDFCLQGGDPTGTGTGSSDNKIVGEFSSNGIENSLADNFVRGTVAFARSNDMNSASCQWFITLGTTYASSLNGKYAAFGTIDDAGMQIVDQIVSDYTAKATGSSGTISSKDDQPVITSIVVS